MWRSAKELTQRIRHPWERLRDGILSWIYPEVCQLCLTASATPQEGYVCRSCAGQIRWMKPPCCDRCGLPFSGEITTTFVCPNCSTLEFHFSHARSLFAAQGVGLELVHRYKYRRALWFDPLFQSWISSRVAPLFCGQGWDALVPVPLHPIKQREREFNQAVRLASHLQKATGIPLESHWLRRVVPTPTQTTLSRKQRSENVRTAFQCVPRLPDRMKRIVLIDDVFTTGATSNACARVLRDSGASEVSVWTLARGL